MAAGLVGSRRVRHHVPTTTLDLPLVELLRLGCDLIRQAEALPMPDDLPASPGHPALLHRDGLLIALLAMRPLHQRNMLELQIGKSLRRDGDGWLIQIPASESKTHLALTMGFPEVLLPALHTYLATYRPRLLALRSPMSSAHRSQPAGFHLWITRCGTAMTTGSLQKALARHTERRFGHHINVHLFRDCAASSLADDDPAQVRLAADLLDHRSFQTTAKHYITANQKKSLRLGQAEILKRRKSSDHSTRGRQQNPVERDSTDVYSAQGDRPMLKDNDNR